MKIMSAYSLRRTLGNEGGKFRFKELLPVLDRQPLKAIKLPVCLPFLARWIKILHRKPNCNSSGGQGRCGSRDGAAV